jgi:peroxiredoxin
MSTVVLAARIALSVVFLVAAVGKLSDLRGSRASLVGFGLPERAANVLGTVLPIAELAVAVALIPQPSAQWGAVGGLVLLLAFVAGITVSLRRGEAPDCNCFGAIHSAPVSRTTLARNIGLAAVAVVIVGWGPGPAIDTWVSARSAAELAAIGAGIVALVLLATAVPMWLDNRRLRRELAIADQHLRRIPLGLRVGALAPGFSLPDENGGRITLESLLARGRPVALVFVSAGCGPCEAVLPELRRLANVASDRLTFALLGANTIARYDSARKRHGDQFKLVEAIEEDPGLQDDMDELFEVMQAYQTEYSPSAVIVTPAGTIGSAVVDGRLAIEALIRLTLSGSNSAAQPSATAPAAPRPASVV